MQNEIRLKFDEDEDAVMIFDYRKATGILLIDDYCLVKEQAEKLRDFLNNHYPKEVNHE